MNRSLEQRVKQKLHDIEKVKGIPFNRLLETLFLERILVRIGKSKHADTLIFKGGMCLAQFFDLKRATKDIDFLLKNLKANEETIKKIFNDIAALDVGDGISFGGVKIEQLSIEHKKYPGYRISMRGTLGQIRNDVDIDIGVGDVVKPKRLEIGLLSSKEPLFEESIELQAYPPEYIFSEKFEAILHLGDINGRMKDYYDCYRMIIEDVLNVKKLHEALKETLSTRGTELELIPEYFIGPLTVRWNSFVKKEKLEALRLESVVQTINNFLQENKLA